MMPSRPPSVRLISCLNSSPLAAFTSSVVGIYTPRLGVRLIRWAIAGWADAASARPPANRTRAIHALPRIEPPVGYKGRVTQQLQPVAFLQHRVSKARTVQPDPVR